MWFGVGWARHRELPCDAVKLQLHNLEMVEAAMDRTMQRVYCRIIKECYAYAQSGCTSRNFDVKKLITFNWDKNIPGNDSCMDVMFKMVQEKLKQQGFNVNNIAGSDLININW